MFEKMILKIWKIVLGAILVTIQAIWTNILKRTGSLKSHNIFYEEISYANVEDDILKVAKTMYLKRDNRKIR
ncbi:hypothetical protein K8R42_02830 [bacterium]|nr:hypothetical protein [bacterium]